MSVFLYWVIFGTNSSYVVFMCKPLSSVCCQCKHCVVLFKISLNTTLFSQCCLFILRVWVNGRMGVQVRLSVSLCLFSLTHLPPPSQCFCLSISTLFGLCLLVCLSSYVHFPLLLSRDIHFVFSLKIPKFFICMVAFVTKAGGSIQHVY